MASDNVFYLGPPSIKQPFRCKEDFASAARAVLAALDLLTPALQSGRVSLCIDAELSVTKAYNGVVFDAALDAIRGLPESRDIVVRWHRIRTSHGLNFQSDVKCRAKMAFRGVEYIWYYDLCESVVSRSYCWLSFSGSPLGKFSSIQVGFAGGNLNFVNIASCHDSLLKVIPEYEPNPKHRKKGYHDGERNVWVSPMPLSDGAAQDLLLRSIFFSGCRWACSLSGENYYRFVKTYVDRHVYHGFQVSESAVPPKALSLLNG